MLPEFTKEEVINDFILVRNAVYQIYRLYLEYKDVKWIFHYCNSVHEEDIIIFKFYVSSKGDVLINEWFQGDDQSDSDFFIIKRRIDFPDIELDETDTDLCHARIPLDDRAIVRLVDKRLQQKIERYERREMEKHDSINI
jgi:hypothetical protein